jgi:hypothetical protein
VSTVWRPLSGSPVQPSPLQPSGWPTSAVQPSGVSSRPSVQPPGVQPSGARRVRPYPRAARRSAQSDLEEDAGGGLGRPAGEYRPRSGRVSLGSAAAALDQLIDRRPGCCEDRPVGRDRASVGSGWARSCRTCRMLNAHAVRGLNERDGCRPDSVPRLRFVVVIKAGRLGWTGSERATGSRGRGPCGPGAAQAGSERCRLGLHSILFRSSLHTLAVVLRTRATSTPPPMSVNRIFTRSAWVRTSLIPSSHGATWWRSTRRCKGSSTAETCFYAGFSA